MDITYNLILADFIQEIVNGPILPPEKIEEISLKEQIHQNKAESDHLTTLLDQSESPEAPEDTDALKSKIAAIEASRKRWESNYLYLIKKLDLTTKDTRGIIDGHKRRIAQLEKELADATRIELILTRTIAKLKQEIKEKNHVS